MSRLSLEGALELLPYFARLRPDERVRVAREFKSVEIQDGGTASVEEPVLVIVLSGELVLIRNAADRTRLFPGDAVGGVELLAGRSLAGTLQARGPAVAAVLDRPSLQRILEQFPAVALPWMAAMGRELSWRNELLREVLLARSAKLSAGELRFFLRRRRAQLRRRRQHSIQRIGALLARALLVEPARRPAFWILAGAALALVSARTVVAVILRRGLQGSLFALIQNSAGHPIHVHHFNYGLLLVALIGFLAMIPRLRRNLRGLSFFYGFGLGLVVDEFALLWNLNPDYHQPGSRLAGVALIFALLQIVYFRSLYVALGRRLLARVTS